MNVRTLIVTCLAILAPVHLATATQEPSGEKRQDISMTILYDNYVFTEGLTSDWGFSCIVKGLGRTILFDTGARSELLLGNMEKLKVDPEDVELVVISHNHADHTGGLLAFLRKNHDVTVYLPLSCSDRFVQQVKGMGARVITPDGPVEIWKGGHLAGPLGTQIVERSKRSSRRTGCTSCKWAWVEY